jgi:hypothetical protein
MDVRPVLDVVVGDFGRPATLRYLRQLSQAEQRVIRARAPLSGFVDEARKIDQVTLPLSRGIKGLQLDELSPEEICARPIRDLLFWEHSDPEQVDHMAERLLTLTEAWLCGTDLSPYAAVRLVIPCNSLHEVVCATRRLLGVPGATSTWSTLQRLRDTGQLRLPSVPEVVVGALASEAARRWRVVGTPLGVEAYAREARRLAPGVEVRGYDQHRTASLARVLAAVDENEGALAEFAADEGELIVFGCTDFAGPGGVDSLGVFTEAMVAEVYGGQ